MPAPVVATIAAAETASTIVIFFNTDFPPFFKSASFKSASCQPAPTRVRAAQCHRCRALLLAARFFFGARSGFDGFAIDRAVRPEDGAAVFSARKCCEKLSWERAR